MKTEKVIVHKSLKEYVQSLTSDKINFVKENEALVSFTLSKENWEKLFYETIISGNNPWELYSWSHNHNSQHYN